MKTLADYANHMMDSYQEFCNYLIKEYGACKYPYYDQRGSRSNEGIFRHHRFEDTISNLCSQDKSKYYDDKYQAAEALVPAMFLDHLYLHILIGEQSTATEGLGFGGATTLIGLLDNYFNNGVKVYSDQYYNELDKELYEILKARCNSSMKKVQVVFDHNITICNQAQQYLEEKGKALIELGTGLGKTSTALQILQDNYNKALVLCPNNLIKDGWDAYSKVDTMTYQSFANCYKTLPLDKYDLFILDESHHIGYDEEKDKGAAVWSKGIKYLIKNNYKVLGLTATPERTDKIDIANTIFKDCVCKGLSIEDAIEQGIIYPFSYITALYDTGAILEECEEEDDGSDAYKKLLGQLDLALNNTKTVRDILLTYKPADARIKGIVFISEIEDEDNVRDILKDVYPNKEIRAIHSRMNDIDVEANRKWFEETMDGFLIAVNMVSEGAHYRDINAIIMFRQTKSYQVFAQQLGRIIVLTKYNNPDAVVFDFVNNIENVEMASIKRESKNAHTIRKIIETLIEFSSTNKSSQIIVADETKDVVASLRKLKEYLNNSWQPWEDEIIKQYYPTEGAEGCMKRINEEWERRSNE